MRLKAPKSSWVSFAMNGSTSSLLPLERAGFLLGLAAVLLWGKSGLLLLVQVENNNGSWYRVVSRMTASLCASSFTPSVISLSY